MDKPKGVIEAFVLYAILDVTLMHAKDCLCSTDSVIHLFNKKKMLHVITYYLL